MIVSHGATILHADLDAFFASVEQRDDPSLRGRPVVVGGGVVLAASYEAKAYGVETAMGGRRARRLCPDAIVVPPRMSAYAEASKAVYRVFDDTTPLVEGLSIDEAFLDVRGMQRIAGSPVEIAVRLRRRVLDEVGLPLTVGVARTKFLAKVASGVAKPDGLLVVPPDCELEFLHPPAGSSTRWLTTAILAPLSAVAAGARSAPSARSAVRGRRGRRARSTPCSTGSSTALPDGCARPAASGAPSCFGSASTTSPGRRARTRSPGRPTRRG
jgi:hypothetical protein